MGSATDEFSRSFFTSTFPQIIRLLRRQTSKEIKRTGAAEETGGDEMLMTGMRRLDIEVT